MHRHVRRVGDEIAAAVENGAGEVEPLLDVHGVRGVLQPQAHLLGDRHEEIVENLQPHRIDLSADRRRRRARARALEHEVVELGDRRAPLRFYHGGRVRLGDDRRPLDRLPGGELLASVERRLVPGAGGEQLYRLRGLRGPSWPRRHFARRIARRDRFRRHGFGDQRAIGHEKGELLAIGPFELGEHLLARAEVHHERRIGAVVLEMRARLHADALHRHALQHELIARFAHQFVGHALEGHRRVELRLHRALAHRRLVGKPHAVGREHSRVRMDEDARHAERIGDEARVLAGGAAEAVERIARHVVAALHRDLLDRVRHVADRDLHVALRHRLGAAAIANRTSQLLELARHDPRVQRLLAVRPEDAREKRRLDFPQHHVRIGHGERPAAPVARRARIGAGGIGPHAIARAVVVQNRAAARGDGMDRHHRRAHAYPRDLGLELAFEAAGVVRHVGGRATHVEADDAREARRFRGACRADDAARRPGEDRVLALEASRIGQAAVRLHEEEAHALQLGCHLAHIAAQDRGQVRIYDRRIATPDELHERAHAVRHGDLREPGLLRQLRYATFMVGVAVAVHEHDRHRAEALGIRRLQIALRALGVEWQHDLAARADALFDLDYLRVEHFRQDDVAIEEPRAVLVGDAQRVAKTARDEEHGALAFALEERVGRYRGAHLHRFDALAGDRRARRDAEKRADAGERRVAIALGVLREQLVRDDRAIGLARHYVGECAAAIDPELPAAHAKHFLICDTARMVSPIRAASSGSAWEESLAITSSFLRAMKRFCPWMPSAKMSGASPSRMYHWLR